MLRWPSRAAADKDPGASWAGPDPAADPVGRLPPRPPQLRCPRPAGSPVTACRCCAFPRSAAPTHRSALSCTSALRSWRCA